MAQLKKKQKTPWDEHWSNYIINIMTLFVADPLKNVQQAVFFPFFIHAIPFAHKPI